MHNAAVKSYAVKVLLAAISTLLVAMGGNESPATAQGDAFMLLVKGHQFKEAGKLFFYPEDFAPSRLEHERAVIADFLQSLFVVAGEVNSQTHSLPLGASTWWNLGITATDKPLAPGDVGADSSDTVYYLVGCTNQRKAVLALYFVHVRGSWVILNFEFRIPRSADRGLSDFQEFSRKVFSGCRACQLSEKSPRNGST